MNEAAAEASLPAERVTHRLHLSPETCAWAAKSSSLWSKADPAVERELGQTQEDPDPSQQRLCCLFQTSCVNQERLVASVVERRLSWLLQCPPVLSELLAVGGRFPLAGRAEHPSARGAARSDAAAEPNFNERSRGCSVLSIRPWEVTTFLTRQLGSFGFRS